MTVHLSICSRICPTGLSRKMCGLRNYRCNTVLVCAGGASDEAITRMRSMYQYFHFFAGLELQFGWPGGLYPITYEIRGCR